MIRLLFLKDHPGCNMKSGFGGGMFRENIQQAVAVILARDEDGQKCKWIHEQRWKIEAIPLWQSRATC